MERKPWDNKPYRFNSDDNDYGSERRTWGNRERRPFGERRFDDRAERPYEERRPFGERRSFGDRPQFGGERQFGGDRPQFGDRRSGGFSGGNRFSRPNYGQKSGPRGRAPWSRDRGQSQAITLDADVAEVFKDTASVNQALRRLIEIADIVTAAREKAKAAAEAEAAKAAEEATAAEAVAESAEEGTVTVASDEAAPVFPEE